MESDDSSLSPPAKEIGDSDKESIHSTHTDSRISLEIRPGMTIKGNSKDYLVKDIIDAGSYGEVYKCHIEDTNQFVALKFVRKSDATDFLNEVKALQRLNNLKHFKRYFIKLNDHFDFKDWFCMEFELLKENLLDFSRRQNRSLKVYEIRAIAKQMLTALRVFKQLGISHADLKPENIMLVNHEKQPFGLKLIDFGAACETEQLPDEYIIQTLGYRAPEVILGLQPDESIDMWSLGCILAELFLNYPLFPTQNEYDNLRVIMKLFGEPNKKQLEDGSLVSDYFIKQQIGSETCWRFKTPDEYQKDGDLSQRAHPAYDDITCLDDLNQPPVKVIENQFDDADIKPKDNKHLELMPGITIKGNSKSYLVEAKVGAGAFGEVARCRIEETDKVVALKIIRTKYIDAFFNEAKQLECLNSLKYYNNYLIRLNECFYYKDCFCQELELLDEDLMDFMRRQGVPLKVSEIRAITKQMLEVLSAFKQLGIVHTDIKPENIMLADHEKQPFRVKLIDFGSVWASDDLPQKATLQNLPYRAPEVILGLPRDEAIDTWSLGCVMSTLFLGRHLFPPENKYDNLRLIMELLGQPDKKILEDGTIVSKYFTKKMNFFRSWRFKTFKEYQKTNEEVSERADLVYHEIATLRGKGKKLFLSCLDFSTLIYPLKQAPLHFQ
uniref:Protein kinase domain-containing protein n=1 Tax=Nothobranchius furzeri TaxID=105023 RepID=A0A8C6L1R6_NOTFU